MAIFSSILSYSNIYANDDLISELVCKSKISIKEKLNFLAPKTFEDLKKKASKYGLKPSHIKAIGDIYRAALWGQSHAIYGITKVDSSKVESDGVLGPWQFLLHFYHRTPKSIDKSGLHIYETPIISASRTGNKKTVMRQLWHHANPNQVDLNKCQTPLIWATKGGYYSTVKYLLAFSKTCKEKKKNWCYKTRYGFLGPGDNDKIRLKIYPYHPISLNHQDYLGRTALHYAAENKEKKIVSFLIDNYGGEHFLDIPDNKGFKPSDLAKKKGHKKIVNIIARGKDLYNRGAQGGWKLQGDVNDIFNKFMAHRKDKDIRYLKFLVNQLAKTGNINAYDNNGKTALISAVEYGQAEIVKMLLAKGAKRYLKCKCAGDEKGRPWRPIDYAKNKLKWLNKFGSSIEKQDAQKIVQSLGG